MSNQKTPNITQDDIIRIIHREFSFEKSLDVERILAKYDEGYPEQYRVQASILKLAEGNLAALDKYVEAAKGDYRDVLYWAEYPNFNVHGFSIADKLPQVQIDQIIEKDWDQYENWLKKS